MEIYGPLFLENIFAFPSFFSPSGIPITALYCPTGHCTSLISFLNILSVFLSFWIVSTATSPSWVIFSCTVSNPICCWSHPVYFYLIFYFPSLKFLYCISPIFLSSCFLGKMNYVYIYHFNILVCECFFLHFEGPFKLIFFHRFSCFFACLIASIACWILMSLFWGTEFCISFNSVGLCPGIQLSFLVSVWLIWN